MNSEIIGAEGGGWKMNARNLGEGSCGDNANWVLSDDGTLRIYTEVVK